MCEVPNLDAMLDADEVWAYWIKWHGRGRSIAQQLFPDRPRGYVRALKGLTNYAANKATAMRCRTAGDIVGAQNYERICDNIYDKLPEYARW